MEQAANHIALTGSLASVPSYSHSNHDRRFYRFEVAVARLSGAIDCLPVLAPEELLMQAEAREGTGVHIEGQIRSFNNRAPTGRRLIISVFAETLCVSDAPHDNEVALQGVICKEPIYRRTPLGRQICDVMLAVNRPYRRADYLPCIFWGQNAQRIAQCSVGSEIALTGRLQSREYIKLLDGLPETRVAFEISAIGAQVTQEPGALCLL